MKKKVFWGMCITMILLIGCTHSAAPQNYSIGEDAVASLTTVVGDLDLVSSDKEKVGSGEVQRYHYSEVSDTKDKMKLYVDFLLNNGFMAIVIDEKLPDLTFTQDSGSGTVAKTSQKDGYIFTISYEYDQNNIWIQVGQIKGSVSPKTDATDTTTESTTTTEVSTTIAA